MISKVTKDNKALYEDRIDQINKAFEKQGSSTRITSFESYFGNIEEIYALSTNFRGSAANDSNAGTPGKFLLLPLDEPLFYIDANKRTINIPADFNKNGIGVRGDHMAETLYFKIDRYFDHQDLFGVDEIIINWQFRPANVSRNAEIPMYTSLAFAPDEEYLPGYVVFGWVVGNYQDENGEWVRMTPSKGVLNFSVSFVIKEGDQYKYALNTMIASVNVNDSLYLENPSILSSLKRPVFDRLRDSRYTEDGIEPVEDPIWRSGQKEKDEFDQDVFKGLYRVANFGLHNDGTEESQVILEAIGHVENQDNVNIKYQWSGKSFATGSAIEGRIADSPTYPSDYIKTRDIEPQPGISYFVDKDGAMLRLTDVSDPTLEEAFADASMSKFEIGSSFPVVEGGIYHVDMQASRETTQSGADVVVSKSRSIDSIDCVVPKAAVPAVELRATSAVLPDDPALGYIVEDEEEAGQHVFVSDSAPGVEAIVTIDDSKIDPVNGIISESELGAIAFKLADESATAPTSAEIEAMEFVPCEVGQSFNVPSESASGEGDYCVYAVNRRNHTYSVSDASNMINVSKIAPKILHMMLMAQEDSNNYTLKLLEDNVKVGEAMTVIGIEKPTAKFEITIADDFSDIGEDGDRPSLELRVVEIDQTAYIESHGTSLVYPQNPIDGSTDEYFPTQDNENLNKYYFQISRDPGWYIIEATTRYHGTKRISVTEPFIVNSAVSFNN